MQKHRLQSDKGFTLIEMSVVLVIVGVFTAAMASVAGTRIEAQRFSNTKEHMEFVVEALKRYVKRYGHLPCPANPALAPSAVGYGEGLGTNSATDSNADGYVDTPGCIGSLAVTGASRVYIGSLPFKELDINSQVTLDGWDNLLTYAVDGDLTFIGYPWSADTIYNGFRNDGNPDLYDDQADLVNRSVEGDIQITNGNGDVVLDKTAYVVISHGANGWGAYTRDGISLGTGTASVTEQGNINTAGTNDPIFTQRMQAQDFDDILLYKTKWMLRSE